MKVAHYLTKYSEEGRAYAEAWIQVEAFGKCWCLWRRRIEI